MADLKIGMDVREVSTGTKTVRKALDEIKKSSAEAVSSLDKMQKSLKSMGVNNARGLNTLVKKFKEIEKIRKGVTNETIAAEKAQKKYNRSIVANELKRGRIALKNIAKEEMLLAREATKAEKVQRKFNRSITSNELKRGASALRNLRKEQEAFTKSQRASLNSINAFTIAMGNLAAKGIAVVISQLSQLPRILKNTSDEWLAFSNRIRVAVDSEKQLIEVQNQLFNIAQETRTPLKEQAVLYNRLSIAQKDLGTSQAEILDVIRGVGFALGVTSTSALESRGALIQLSQAFGQGIVRAEEFNSIMEGAPRIAKALADGFGVTRAQMRAMVLDGKVTSKAFFEAFSSQVTLLKREFQGIQPTIEQAFQVSRNAFTLLIGRINDATGAAQGFANFVVDFSMILRASIPAIVQVSGLVKTLWESLIAFPTSTLQFLRELRQEEDRVSESTGKLIDSLGELSLLSQTGNILSNILVFDLAAVQSTLTTFIAIFFEFVDVLILGVRSATNYWRGFQDVLTLDFKAAKEHLDEGQEIFNTFFQESENNFRAWSKSMDGIWEQRTLDTVNIKTGKNPLVEEAAEAEAFLKKIDAAYRARGQNYRDAETQENTNSANRLKSLEEYYKRTGILDDELLKSKLKIFEDQKELDIKAGLEAIKAEEIKQNKITNFLEIGNSKRLKLLKEFQRIQKKILSETDKLTLTTFEFDKKKLDQDYKRNLELYRKHKRDTLEVDLWYKAQLDKLEVGNFFENDEDRLYKALDDFFKDIDDLEDDYEEKHQKNLKEIAKADKKSLNERQKEYDKFLKSIEDETADTFKDLFTGELDSFSDFTDRMLDIFLDMLATMAAQAIAEPIIVPIIQSVTGQGTSGITGQSITDIPSLLQAGSSAYGAYTGGITSSLSTGTIGNIGTSIFGSGWSTTLAAAPGVGIEAGTGALSVAQGGGGIAGTLGPLLGAAGLGALGYSTLGGLVGLPQGEYSSIGAGLGAAGGAALGAEFGSLGGPIGTAVGAVLGGIAASFLGDTEPEQYAGIGTSNLAASSEIARSDIYGFTGWSQDTNQTFQGPMVEYFENAFDAMDDLLDISVKDVIANRGFDTGWIALSGDTENDIKRIGDAVFEDLREEFVSALNLDADIFSIGLFKDLANGGSLLDTFTQLAQVMEGVDGFAELFTNQMVEFGISAEQAFRNLSAVYNVLQELDNSVKAITETGIRSQLQAITDQWGLLSEALEDAYATTEQLIEVEEKRNALVGSQLTGFTASSLQSILTGTGDFSGALQKSLSNILSVQAAETIATEFLLPLNEAVGAAFIESGNDLSAAAQVLKEFDLGPLVQRISDFQTSFIDVDTARKNYITALNSEISVLQEAQDQIQETYDEAATAYISALESEINIKQSAIDVTEDLIASISAYRREILLSDAIPSAQSLTLAKSSFEAGVQGLFSNDPRVVQESFKNLPSLGKDFLSASKAVNADFTNYQADVNQVLTALSTAEDIGGVQLSTEQAQLDILSDTLESVQGSEAATKSLEELSNEFYTAKAALDASQYQTQIDYYTNQLIALEAINNSVLSLSEARSQFNSATGSSTNLADLEAVAGTSYLEAKAAQVNSAISSGDQATIDLLSGYGISSNNVTATDISNAFAQAGLTQQQHYTQHGQFEDIPGFADGGISSGPRSGYLTKLHGTEAIVPLQSGYIPVQVSSNSEDNEKLNRVVQLLETMLGVNGMMNRDQAEILSIVQRITQGQNYINTKEVA